MGRLGRFFLNLVLFTKLYLAVLYLFLSGMCISCLNPGFNPSSAAPPISAQSQCYTCTSDPGGINYEYCREVGIYHYVPMPPAYTCPEGKCIKMDIIVKGERSPR